MEPACAYFSYHFYIHPRLTSFKSKIHGIVDRENNITLEQLIKISSQSSAEEKFEIANLLDFGSWIFKTEKKSSLNAARSLILHEAATMGRLKRNYAITRLRSR